MKRSFVVIWAVALFVVTIPLIAAANTPTAPHWTNGMACQTCHTSTPNGPGYLDGLVVTSPAIYNNACQNCHRPGDASAAAKPLASTDASEVFGGQGTAAGVTRMQTSHRWDGSDTNPAAGATPPVMGPMTTASFNGSYNLRGRTGNQLACARCHSMHNSNPNGNFLRMANDQDQMCMDCHVARAQQSHLSGTHPVNVNYAAAAAASAGSLNTAIKNANPANTTSDLSTKLTSTGNVVCSTCHGVHYTDSRSSTFDGPSSAKGRYNYANLSSGDGYILRTDRRAAAVASGQPDNLNICTNCHAGKMSHNSKNQNIQCTDCHGAHVEYDPTNSSVLNPQNKPNVYLIQRNPTNPPGANKIYFRYTGNQREYKNANNTGVCQSCHAVPTGAGYPAAHSSATATASDCNSCHMHNSLKGSFSVACDGCHGNPPTTTALAGPNGLASPATGALGGTAAGNNGAPGAHAKHAVLHNMACNTCHNGYEQRAMPSQTIDMGFAINGTNVPGFKGVATGGTYNNSGSLLNGYTFTMAGSGTNRTCSAVYCHGGTLTQSPGTQLPSWTGNSSASQCGMCHSITGDELTMGSHITHAGSTQQLDCGICHPAVLSGTSHMQGSVQWNLTAIGAGAQYKPAGANTVYATVGETGFVAPSTAGYGTCNNIVCHGRATNIQWGGTLYSTTETCAKCHSSQLSVATDNAFYSTATPKVTLNTNAQVGAHASHLNGTDKIAAALTCNDCHGTVDVVNQAGHMDGTVNFNWGPLATANNAVATYSNGTCSNYCHGSAMPKGDVTGSNRNPSWSDATYLPATLTPAACGTCHGFPPSRNVPTSTHYNMAIPTGFPLTGCSCHPTINPAGTTYANIFVTGANGEKHLDGNLDVSGGTCNGCHGYPPANKRFAGSAGNWADAKMENYTGGGGAHTVAGHIKPTAVAGEAFTNCTPCHTQNDHAMSPIAFNPSTNIKVRLDSRIRFASNVQAKYSSNKKDGAQHVPGRCSSVACHFQKSPKW